MLIQLIPVKAVGPVNGRLVLRSADSSAGFIKQTENAGHPGSQHIGFLHFFRDITADQGQDI